MMFASISVGTERFGHHTTAHLIISSCRKWSFLTNVTISRTVIKCYTDQKISYVSLETFCCNIVKIKSGHIFQLFQKLHSEIRAKCLSNQNAYLRKPLAFTSYFLLELCVSSRSQTTSPRKTTCQINTWESLAMWCAYEVLISYSLKSFLHVFPLQSHLEMDKIPHFIEGKTDARGNVICPVMASGWGHNL